MLKDALKEKKRLISSLMLEGQHRPAFILQDQKPVFFCSLIKCAAEADLYMKIKVMSREK